MTRKGQLPKGAQVLGAQVLGAQVLGAQVLGGEWRCKARLDEHGSERTELRGLGPDPVA